MSIENKMNVAHKILNIPFRSIRSSFAVDVCRAKIKFFIFVRISPLYRRIFKIPLLLEIKYLWTYNYK